jgi:hypothetical protein
MSITGFLGSPWLAYLFWILYIAAEPYVRRRWPQILVSWTQLLSGEWRDTLIARDVLIGCALAVLMIFLQRLPYYLAAAWFGYSGLDPFPSFDFAAVLGIRFFTSVLIGRLVVSIFLNLGWTSLLFFLRILLRSQKAAIVICVIFLALTSGIENPWNLPYRLAGGVIVIFALMRFGLLVAVLIHFASQFFISFPATLDVSAWYFGYGFAAIVIFMAIVLYAFRVSLGGRPIIASPNLDD